MVNDYVISGFVVEMIVIECILVEMTLKTKWTNFDEKKQTISKITYGKKDIWWFFQWLKVAVDLEGKNIEFGTSNYKGGGSGSATRTIKHKVKITAFKDIIDLKEIKKIKPILLMTDREKFKYMDKMFLKYRHLFGDFTLRLIKSPNDLINDENYFTVQIPKSKNNVDIDRELSIIKENFLGMKKDKEGKWIVDKKRPINFHRGIKFDELNRLWKVYVLKETTDLQNQVIAKRVGYKTGSSYKMKNQNQTAGIRQVQIAYNSAKRMILNIAKGDFPKNRI